MTVKELLETARYCNIELYDTETHKKVAKSRMSAKSFFNYKIISIEPQIEVSRSSNGYARAYLCVFIDANEGVSKIETQSKKS